MKVTVRLTPGSTVETPATRSKLPVDPAAALRSQVSRLRRALGPGAGDLVAESGAYRLQVARDQLDAARFEALLAGATDHEGEAALRLVEEALALWRGPALGDLADRPFAQPEAVRLDELYWSGRERRAELLLGIGRVTAAGADLESLLAAQPQREHARALLMEARYREGRHTDALDVFQSWRRHLGEELGLEPSPELQRAEREILRHTLGAAPPAPRASRPSPPPAPASSLVGREDDLASLAELIEHRRLVTLTGPGGVGKTRLALEAAARAASRYPDGVCFCDLAVLGRGGEVVRAVATALGVEERGQRRFLDQLVDHLAGRRLLLLLDSCEHVLDAAAALAEQLIQYTGQADVLATSRERLAVDGEQLWPVPPLSTGGADPPAVRLFVDRVLAIVPDFEATPEARRAIGEICGRLDGLPLAIELAAARLGGLTVDELATRLDQRFQWLTEGRRTSPRHRSLRAVVDWSHDQLSLAEQRVFRRLATFARSFDLDVARMVAAGEGVAPEEVGPVVLGLVQRSLVSERPTPHGSRYSLLDTVKAYGLEQLEVAGELPAVQARHAQWAVEFAEQAEAGLAGADEGRWATAVLERWDELRAAHDWLVGCDTDGSLRLVGALHLFGLWRNQSEVFRWAEVAAAAATAPSGGLPAALAAAGAGAWLRGDLETAAAKAQQGLDAAQPAHPLEARRPLEVLGDVALLRGDLARAVELYGAAAGHALAAGDLAQAVWDLGGQSLAYSYGGDGLGAARAAADTMAVALRSGSPTAVAYAHYALGEMHAAQDQPDRAEEELEQALALAEPVGSRYVTGLAQVTLATVRAQHLDVGGALRHCQSLIVEWQSCASWTAQWITLRTLIGLLTEVEADEDAALLYGAVTSARSGAALFGADQERLRRAAARLRGRLGETAFEEHVHRGKALSDNEVITAALDAVGRATMTAR